MKVLFIGAHYDDIELGCGGTILRHIEKGDDVFYLGLSNCGNELLNDDPFFDNINNTEGKIYEAVLNVLLRMARDGYGSEKFDTEIKDRLTVKLTSGDLSPAFLWQPTRE